MFFEIGIWVVKLKDKKVVEMFFGIDKIVFWIYWVKD